MWPVEIRFGCDRPLLGLVQSPSELRPRNANRLQDAAKGQERDIPFAALDSPDIRPVKPGSLGQPLLRESGLQPELANNPAETTQVC